MSGFIGKGKIGIWVWNRDRNLFLDWLAEHRAGNDPKWREKLLSEAHRWMGCCLDLEELIPEGAWSPPTENELAAAANVNEHFPTILRLVAATVDGSWKHDVGSLEAIRWKVPWTDGFTEEGIWTAKCLDLYLEFAEPNAATVLEAISALWAHIDLQGCWVNNDREPMVATRLPAPFYEDAEVDTWGPPEFNVPTPRYGFAMMRGRTCVPCATYIGLDEDCAFLKLSFRSAAIQRRVPPRIEAEGPCDPAMFRWLAAIGRSVHNRVPIHIGIVGWEVVASKDSEMYERKFEATQGYLLPNADGLEYVAPTIFSWS